jgi:hypothetical protein
MREFSCALLLLVVSTTWCAQAEQQPLTEKAKIEALILRIENLKDAVFVRNGTDYDAATAARFLRAKWQGQTKEIATAAEFIEKAASQSSTSGKAYMVRFKDGRDVKCGDYLKAELAKIEEQQKDQQKP